MPYAVRCCRLGESAGPMSCVLQGMANPGQGLLTQVPHPPDEGWLCPTLQRRKLGSQWECPGLQDRGQSAQIYKYRYTPRAHLLTGSGLGQRFCALVSLR